MLIKPKLTNSKHQLPSIFTFKIVIYLQTVKCTVNAIKYQPHFCFLLSCCISWFSSLKSSVLFFKFDAKCSRKCLYVSRNFTAVNPILTLLSPLSKRQLKKTKIEHHLWTCSVISWYTHACVHIRRLQYIDVQKFCVNCTYRSCNCFSIIVKIIFLSFAIFILYLHLLPIIRTS